MKRDIIEEIKKKWEELKEAYPDEWPRTLLERTAEEVGCTSNTVEVILKAAGSYNVTLTEKKRLKESEKAFNAFQSVRGQGTLIQRLKKAGEMVNMSLTGTAYAIIRYAEHKGMI